jgi:opacity protein-like surface antigen
MKRIAAIALLAAGLAAPALAQQARQEVTINRTSTTDQISGLVVQGESIVLVYGAPGMGATNQAVRITPDGNRLRVVYDTVGAFGVNTAGLTPMMMMNVGGRQWPIYNMTPQ